MVIKQLSVFLQNELGRLEEVTDILYKNDINISALSIAETAEYGILRMIVSDIDKAAEALKKRRVQCKNIRRYLRGVPRRTRRAAQKPSNPHRKRNQPVLYVRLFQRRNGKIDHEGQRAGEGDPAVKITR